MATKAPATKTAAAPKAAKTATKTTATDRKSVV